MPLGYDAAFRYSFANPLAHQWYLERSFLAAICKDLSVPNQQAQYNTGLIMSGEYITRAYTILYEYNHGRRPGLFELDKNRSGFPHIVEVFQMIVAFENQEINVN